MMFSILAVADNGVSAWMCFSLGLKDEIVGRELRYLCDDHTLPEHEHMANAATIREAVSLCR